eukprot:SAG11_NODE_1249_length_5393_cov_4.349641_4_plen_76_part_00
MGNSCDCGSLRSAAHGPQGCKFNLHITNSPPSEPNSEWLHVKKLLVDEVESVPGGSNAIFWEGPSNFQSFETLKI